MSDDLDELANGIGTRQKYVQFLKNQFTHGQLTRMDLMRLVTEYDALAATKPTQPYSIVLTIAGAVSALAAILSAYLSLLAHD